MPVFIRQFTDLKTNQLSPEHLRSVGPRLPVEIGLPDVLAAHLTQSGQPIPSPAPGFALVDTGASATCVDESILKNLGLNPVGSVNISTPSGVEVRSVYPAKISFPGTPMPELHFAAVAGVSLQNQGYVALIGRDILVNMVLIFNGPGAHVTFAF